MMREQLSAEQLEAVGARVGPLLISAGAGAGKTRVLAERYVAALDDARSGDDAGSARSDTAADEILTITFTTKAAGELDERIRRSLARNDRADEALRMDKAWISTIHGFCSRLLRRHALEAGLDPAFTMADGVEAAMLRAEAFEESARASLGTAAGERLFETYGVSDLAEMVESLSAARRSSQGTDGRWLVQQPEAVVRIAGDAHAFFSDAVSELDDYTSSSRRAQQHAECCTVLTDELASCLEVNRDEFELAQSVWTALDEYSASGSAKAIAEIVAEISTVRDELIARAAQAALAPLETALRSLVDDFDERYRALRRERGWMDFDDLQTEALRLLIDHPEIAARYRNKFRTVMVDEFQDTDGLQLALVEAVTSDNLCTVGDEHQSIYRFRGAQVDVYRQHREAMRSHGATAVSLGTNYRSHPDLLAFSNALFTSGELFGSDFPVLRPGRTGDDRNEPVSPTRVRIGIVDCTEKVLAADSSSMEARYIAERLAELVTQGFEPGQMAILVRTYARADVFVRALAERAISATVIGGSRFFGMPEVQALRSACRLIANPHDDQAFVSFALSPMSALSDDVLWRLRHDSGRDGARTSLWDAAMLAVGQDESHGNAALAAVVTAVNAARGRLGTAPLAEVLVRFTTESGALSLLADKSSEPESAFANVLKFGRKAAAYEASGGAGLAGLVARIDAEETFGEHEPPADYASSEQSSVRIMSIHAAKGLEFPVVAVPLLGDQRRRDYPTVVSAPGVGGMDLAMRLPNDWLSRNDERHRHHAFTARYSSICEADRVADLEERKRLFYVACTRAEEHLVLSGSSALGKPPEGASAMDWMRRWLGPRLSETEQPEIRISGSDGATVAVTVMAPPAPRVTACDGADSDADCRAAGSGMVDQPGARAGSSVAPDGPGEPSATVSTAQTHERITIERLSYSDIASFERCPRRFEMERLLRMGQVHGHEPEDPRRFGSAVHAALQLGQAGVGPTDARLESIARYHRLGAGSVSDLRRVVDAALRSASVSAAHADGAAMREAPFAVPVGQSAFLLVGSMDLYTRKGREALIVDYKIGTRRAGDPETRRSFEWQARCYAYAALRSGVDAARVAFVMVSAEGDDTPVAEEVEFTFSAKDADHIERQLIDVHATMAAGSYVPPSRNERGVCRGCPAEHLSCS